MFHGHSKLSMNMFNARCTTYSKMGSSPLWPVYKILCEDSDWTSSEINLDRLYPSVVFEMCCDDKPYRRRAIQNFVSWEFRFGYTNNLWKRNDYVHSSKVMVRLCCFLRLTEITMLLLFANSLYSVTFFLCGTVCRIRVWLIYGLRK